MSVHKVIKDMTGDTATVSHDIYLKGVVYLDVQQGKVMRQRTVLQLSRQQNKALRKALRKAARA